MRRSRMFGVTSAQPSHALLGKGWRVRSQFTKRLKHIKGVILCKFGASTYSCHLMWDIFNGILGILPFINSWCYTGSTIWWTRLFLCRIFIKGCQNFDCSFSPKKVTILCFYNFGAKIVISFSCLKEKCNTCSIFIQTLTHPKSVSKSFQKWRV